MLRQPATKPTPSILFFSIFIALLFQPETAAPQTSFYEGKTIRIVQGRSPGGFGDMRVKALIPFMQKHIPGRPTILSEYMPGGGGRTAANHIFKMASPDGLTMGNAGAGLVTNAVLGGPGVEYRLEKLIFLGAPDGGSYQSLFVTRKEIGAGNLDKLRAAAGVRIGSVAVGHSTYNEGRLFAYFLDLKEPRFVTGYAGPEIDLALERGEVDARAQNIDNFLKRSSNWIDKGSRVSSRGLRGAPRQSPSSIPSPARPRDLHPFRARTGRVGDAQGDQNDGGGVLFSSGHTQTTCRYYQGGDAPGAARPALSQGI